MSSHQADRVIVSVLQKVTLPQNPGCESINSEQHPLVASEPNTSVGHHIILAHAYAVKAFREETFPTHGGSIGITCDALWFIPYDDAPESTSAKLLKS